MAENECESPTCFNDFWSVLGCQNDKLREIRLERRRDLLQGRTLLNSAPEKPHFQVDDSPESAEDVLSSRFFCCRRRSEKPPVRAAAAKPWVWAPKPEESELDLEWKIVEHELDAKSMACLRSFRKAVVEAGLDSHRACANTPHSQRPGTLVRYLRARNWNQELSMAMFRDALDWRRDYDLDAKLEAWRAEWKTDSTPRVQLWRKYGYVKCIGLDHDGLPIWLHRMSQCDAGGLVREAGIEAFILFHIAILEDSFARAQERMMKTGKLITNFVEIYDQGDYGHVDGYLRRGWGSWEGYKQMIPILDKVYPERLRVSFLLRCPRIFAVFWRLVEPLLPATTVKKIRIKGYAASSFVEELKGPRSDQNSWRRPLFRHFSVVTTSLSWRPRSPGVAGCRRVQGCSDCHLFSPKCPGACTRRAHPRARKPGHRIQKPESYDGPSQVSSTKQPKP